MDNSKHKTLANYFYFYITIQLKNKNHRLKKFYQTSPPSFFG
jgi:hypothetical protein